MVGKTGFRIQDSGFRLMLTGVVLLLASGTWHLAPAFAQQPQAQQGQPLSALNAKYVNGVGPGYWPTAGSGLTLNLSAGTALCGNPPAPVTYAGGTLTLTAAATNYVYLDPLLSCAPSLNTSGFGVGQIPIAVVVTNASTITGVNDVRTFFSPPTTMDSTGRSIFKGLNGAYFADQLGDKSTTGIASAISACGSSTPCRVVVPGSYATTETVPGAWNGGQGRFNAGTTSANIQVQDFRQGDYQTAINQQGAGYDTFTWHQWVQDMYAPTAVSPSTGGFNGDTSFSVIMNHYDGGMDMSCPDPSCNYYVAKTAYLPFQIIGNNWGIGEMSNQFVMNSYAPGDTETLYAFNNFYAGPTTPGEEGPEVADFWLMQGNVAYRATIASGGMTGSTSLTLSPTAGGGTQGSSRYLIDCGTVSSGQDCSTGSKVISSGTISAMTVGTMQTMTGSGTSWPVSTVNTTTTQGVTSPGVHTITVASTTNITTSTLLVIWGHNNFADYETVIPSAVGTGSCPGASCTITANFFAPHATGAIVAAGGLSGWFIELTADTASAALTGGSVLRQAWPVLYSTSSTSLVALVGAGGLYSAANTQWANTSGQNGYVLYPGAEVSSVYASGAVGNTFTLMPNTVAWANGDTVEEPQHPQNYALLGSWNLQSWWPTSGILGPVMNFIGVPGPNTNGLRIQNFEDTSPSSPLANGRIEGPGSVFNILGPWGIGLRMYGYGPNVTGLNFAGQTWGATGASTVIPFNVNSGSGWDGMTYSTPTRTWTLTAGGGSAPYSFGPTSMSAPGHLGSSSADVAGYVTISSSTSATVNFGTSYNSAPKCVVTPTSDPTSVGAYWVTSTTSGFTVNVHTSGTITFNYVCVGI